MYKSERILGDRWKPLCHPRTAAHKMLYLSLGSLLCSVATLLTFLIARNEGQYEGMQIELPLPSTVAGLSFFRFFMDPTLLSRSERFPSKEERLQLYLGDWARSDESCQRQHSYYMLNATTLVTKELTGRRRRLELQSKVALDHLFWVEPHLLKACAFEPKPAENLVPGGEKLQTFCQNSMDLINTKSKVLMQYGDGLQARGFGVPSVPHIRKVRNSLARYGNCVQGNSTTEAIIWKLNVQRHFGLITEVEENDIPWAEKTNSAVFRGALTAHHRSGEIAAKIDDDYARCMELSRCRMTYELGNSPIVDAKLTRTLDRVNSSINGVSLVGSVMKLDEMLRNKAIVILEGNDVSSGLKWALFSNSVVLMPPPTFTSWAMEELLQPFVHYVPLNKELTDVESKMQWILNHDEAAQQIAQRGKLWIQDLVLDDNARSDDEWIQNEIIRRYSEIMVETDRSM